LNFIEFIRRRVEQLHEVMFADGNDRRRFLRMKAVANEHRQYGFDPLQINAMRRSTSRVARMWFQAANMKNLSGFYVLSTPIFGINFIGDGTETTMIVVGRTMGARSEYLVVVPQWLCPTG
jgi:hypothetical protein